MKTLLINVDKYLTKEVLEVLTENRNFNIANVRNVSDLVNIGQFTKYIVFCNNETPIVPLIKIIAENNNVTVIVDTEDMSEEGEETYDIIHDAIFNTCSPEWLTVDSKQDVIEYIKGVTNGG